MAADILTKEPTEVRAGDTAIWTKAFSDYPRSDGWTLKYAFNATGSQVTVEGEDDPNAADGWLVTLPKEDTAAMTAGVYAWAAYVELGDERFTVDDGTVTILPDLVAASTGSEARSDVRIIFEALEATIKRRATKSQLSQMINGQQITHMTTTDLIEARDKYRGYLDSEIADENIKNGLGSGSKIMARMVIPQ